MSQACAICNHPKRLEIDRELVQGKAKSEVSRKYNVPYNSVDYHSQNHLSHQLRTAYEKKQAIEGLDLLSEIEELISRTKRIMDQAENENKLNTALNAIGQARGSYELLSKIAFSLHQARLAELELEREKSGHANKEEQEAFAKEAMDRLTDNESDLLLRLIDKAHGKTDEIIEPGQYLPRMDFSKVKSKKRSKPKASGKPAWMDEEPEPEPEEPEPAFTRTRKPVNAVKNIPGKVIPGGGRIQDNIRTKKQRERGEAE